MFNSYTDKKCAFYIIIKNDFKMKNIIFFKSTLYYSKPPTFDDFSAK